jgi:hypothetical protein
MRRLFILFVIIVVVLTGAVHAGGTEDTDGDGIKDVAELTGFFGFTTDSSSPDTDNDGLTDLDELVTYIDVKNESHIELLLVSTTVIKKLQKDYPYKLDPTNPDTDGDGIPDGDEVRVYKFNPTRDDSLVDSDSDGLDNVEEVNIGTDPHRWDTDYDGIRDSDEVLGTYGLITDPKNKDTDGDGITDTEEVLSISDPLIKDTDDDGMPDGWELRYGLDPRDLSDAGYDYNDDGLTNLEEYEKDEDPLERDVDDDYIDNLAERMGFLGFVTDPFEEDMDDDDLTDLEEIAMYIDVNNRSQMKWIYKPIGVDEEKKKKIREMQKEQRKWIYPWRHDLHNLNTTWILDPTNPDSDGDGLKDGEEVHNSNYGFDPNIDDRTVDLDNDGLDNVGEVLNLSTDPREWDTDEDGLSDGEEVYGIYGFVTDPKSKDTDDDEVPDMEETLGLYPISPSKHAITYERFISGNIYADEYVTTMAKVNKIRTYYGSKEYYIDLKPLKSTPDEVFEGPYGVVSVGNSWHRDIEHGMIFTDDSFGFTPRTDDIIVVCGKADIFEGSKRTIHVNSEGSSGTVLLVLDPLEKKYRWFSSESHIKTRKKFEPVAVAPAPSPSPIPTPSPSPMPTPTPEPTPAPTPTPPEEEKSMFERFVDTLKSVIDYLTPYK